MNVDVRDLVAGMGLITLVTGTAMSVSVGVALMVMGAVLLGAVAWGAWR